MATGWPMKTTYADGDVYAAQDVNDITGTINLLQTSTLSSQAGKNAIINGGFDVWQRGTSFPNITGLIYTADRFQGSLGSMTSGTLSVSRQASGLDAFEYSMRFQRNSGATTTGNGYLTYSTETKNVIPLQGKAVTFSFYARAGANFSMASSTLSFALSTGTGVDLNINTGSFPTSVISASPVLTTSWQRFTYSGTISATAASLGFYWMYTGVGTAGANDWFEITGVQLELGSTATTFSRTGGTIQGELAACQRYYFRYSAQSAPNGSGVYYTSTNALIYVKFPVTMRVTPTYGSSGTDAFSIYSNSSRNSTANSLDTAAPDGMMVIVTTAASTLGYGVVSYLNSASKYLEAVAEL
jgi:hypothetical protein